MHGGDGDDRMHGGDGDDRMYGGAGDDLLRSGAGADNRLYGGDGNDQLYGGNRLYGGKGDDLLYGRDNGDDRLEGGKGDDTLYGGTGDDRFVFDAESDHDTVKDFGDGDDVLVFRGMKRADLDIKDTDAGALISGRDDWSVTLEGVAAADLSESDFDFTG